MIRLRDIRLGDVVFVAALVVLVLAQAVVAWSSLVQARLWEDEAFNLSVPLNLLRGLGYSSDGALSGSTITPFDPRISTGPVMLLPVAGMLATGVDVVVGSRIVPLLFYVALLVALWMLGRRVAGRWGALAAAAVPLAYSARALPSPIQGPADVLGEIAAAALLAWALVALRRRPWLAGLLVGLAVQAKFISLLAVPAFAVALWLGQPGIRWSRRLRSLLLPAVLVVAPSVVFEIVALLSLGPAGYLAHLREMRAFLGMGGSVEAHTTILGKLSAFADAWQLPAVVTVVATLFLAATVVWAVVARRRRDGAVLASGSARDIELLQLGVAAAIGLAAFLGWWVTASHTPLWVRHPAPGVLAFAPILAAFVVAAIRLLWRERGGRAQQIVGPLAAAVLAAALIVPVSQTVAAAAGRDGQELAAQRAAAAELAATPGDRLAGPWGSPVSVILLSGKHIALWDAPVANVGDLPRVLPAWMSDLCPSPEPVAGGYLLCPEPVTP